MGFEYREVRFLETDLYSWSNCERICAIVCSTPHAASEICEIRSARMSAPRIKMSVVALGDL